MLKKIFLFIPLFLLILWFVTPSKDQNKNADTARQPQHPEEHNINITNAPTSNTNTSLNKPHQPPETAIMDSVCQASHCKTKGSSVIFHQFHFEELRKIKEGEFLEIPLPGEVAIKIMITKTERSEKILTISGHLNNYPEEYLTSISIDESDALMGTTMSEKSNFEIRTIGGKTFIFKVIPEMETFSEPDI